MRKLKLLIVVIHVVIGVSFILSSISHYQKVEELNSWLGETGNQSSPFASEMVTEASRESDIFYWMLSLGLAFEVLSILFIMGIRRKPEAQK